MLSSHEYTLNAFNLFYNIIYLQILGKSDFFVFLHKFNTCNCITSKANSKDSPKENRSSVSSSNLIINIS